MSIGYQMLQEARNTGEWLEARIHLMFTEVADGMFGEGRLTRDERKALSAGIGKALNAFRAQVEEAAIQLYSRDPWAPLDNPGTMSEAAADLNPTFVPLVEKAVRRDGTIPLKLIAPGWGSSGYYGPSVLERDGPKAFMAGTKMYWNHPTAVEEAERPEGDLNALAAELVGAARWEAQGVAGAGLYADAKVFAPYQAAVDELAPHIGVSIRASGKAAQGEAEGRKGAIIQEITSARSVDFVTEPGAGGRIVALFEAARTGQRTAANQGSAAKDEEGDMMSEELQKQLQEAQARLAQVEQQNARLQEALLLREARDFVRAQLGPVVLPEPTKQRLYEALTLTPLIKEGKLDLEAYAQRVKEAAAAEATYLAEAVSWQSGRIQGMGASSSAGQAPDPEAQRKRMTEAFGRLGLSEKEAAHAVNGRVG